MKQHVAVRPPDTFSLDEVRQAVLHWGDQKEWFIELCGECERELLRQMDRCLNQLRPVGELQ